jgi:hypothetical protein
MLDTLIINIALLDTLVDKPHYLVKKACSKNNKTMKASERVNLASVL